MVTVITLISVLATGDVSFNATTASSLAVALLVSSATATAAIIIIVVLVCKKRHYKRISDHFVLMESGFKGLDEQIMNLRQLLLSELHSHVLSVETLLISSKEIIASPNSDEGSKSVLRVNIKMMSAKGKTYKGMCKELHAELKDFFAMKYLLKTSERAARQEQPPLTPKYIPQSPKNKAKVLKHGKDYELHLLEEPPSNMTQQDDDLL